MNYTCSIHIERLHPKNAKPRFSCVLVLIALAFGYMTISELRNTRKMTQQELADLIGVHPVTVARWECGTRKPKGTALFALAKALKCAENEINIEA